MAPTRPHWLDRSRFSSSNVGAEVEGLTGKIQPSTLFGMNPMTLLGLLVSLNSLLFWLWWASTGRPYILPVSGVCLAIVFFGIVVSVQERALELSVKGIGTIKAAAHQATVDAQGISDLRKQMEAHRATVDLIAQDAASAKALTSDLSAKADVAEKRVSQLDDAVSTGLKTVKELEGFSELQTLIIAANSDDRKAFDRLWEIGSDRDNLLRVAAVNAVNRIIEDHNQFIHRGDIPVKWPDGVSSETVTLDQIVAMYGDQASHWGRIALLEFVWKNKRFAKKARMALLALAIRDEHSLTATEYAGRFFMQGSNQRLKPLATREHLKWWAENQDTITD